ncbi:MAG: TPM domain-containing protein [Anaerovoracaceae bacterium]
MKRKISIILVSVLALLCLMPAATAAGTQSYVYDNAGILTQDQVNILNVRCNWFDSSGMNVIAATDQSPSASADALAAQYLAGDGLVLLYTPSAGFEVKAYGAAQSAVSEAWCSQMADIADQKNLAAGVYEGFQSLIFNIDNTAVLGTEPVLTDYFNDPVVDYAGYLSDTEISTLNQQLSALRAKYNVDVAICIDETQWGDEAMAAADDTFDYYLYGAGAEDDGIMLYISKEPRNYWITTHGYGEYAVTDNGVTYLKNSVIPYLKQDAYFDACSSFAQAADELLAQAAAGTPYDEATEDYKKPLTAGNIIARIILSLIIGLIISMIIAKGINNRKVEEMNTAREQADAHGYMKPGSFNLQMSQDVFLYSHVDQRLKPKEDSSGGGSHISSSGRSHGGGGGSY